MLDINWNPSRRDLRQFGLLWLPLFAGVLGYLAFRRRGLDVLPVAIWGTAAVVALIALTAPERLRPVVVTWMAASYPIGWTVSHVVLGLTYFGLFTILGLTLRAFGYDPLQHRKRDRRGSYWQGREERRDAASYFRQF